MRRSIVAIIALTAACSPAGQPAPPVAPAEAAAPAVPVSPKLPPAYSFLPPETRPELRKTVTDSSWMRSLNRARGWVVATERRTEHTASAQYHWPTPRDKVDTSRFCDPASVRLFAAQENTKTKRIETSSTFSYILPANERIAIERESKLRCEVVDDPPLQEVSYTLLPPKPDELKHGKKAVSILPFIDIPLEEFGSGRLERDTRWMLSRFEVNEPEENFRGPGGRVDIVIGRVAMFTDNSERRYGASGATRTSDALFSEFWACEIKDVRTLGEGENALHFPALQLTCSNEREVATRDIEKGGRLKLSSSQTDARTFWYIPQLGLDATGLMGPEVSVVQNPAGRWTITRPTYEGDGLRSTAITEIFSLGAAEEFFGDALP